jgi:hypothetical protein
LVRFWYDDLGAFVGMDVFQISEFPDFRAAGIAILAFRR